MRTSELTALARHRQCRAGIGLTLVFSCLVGLAWPQLVQAQPFTITQITNTIGPLGNRRPAISADGSRIAFVSDKDLVPGGNADRSDEIFLFDSGTGLTQITNTTGGGNAFPSINAAGTRIAFASDRDLTPGNPGNADGNREVFLFDTTTGTFTQITNTTGSGFFPSAPPSINAAGTRIAFHFNRDLTPGNPGNADANDEIFLFDTTTGTFTQITNTIIFGSSNSPSINADGSRIAFESDRDLTPGNPGNADGNQEIFLFDTTTGTFAQITNTTGGGFENGDPSINAAGTRIAFVSDLDLTPGNPGNADATREIFLFDTTTGTFTQITSSGGNFNIQPSINAAGTRIVFASSRDLTPDNPGNADANFELFLFDTSTHTLTQITNTAGPPFSGNFQPSINATGTRIAFESDRDLTPGNPGNADGNREIFLASSVAGPTPTIPALAEWGMLLLGLLLAGAMAAALRRPPSP